MKRPFAILLMLSSGMLVPARDANIQPSKRVFLPKSPKAAAYILKLQSNEELVKIVRSEPVYVAMLERAGLDQAWRDEAVQGLAKLHDSEPLIELLEGIQRVAKSGGAAALDVLPELARMLLAQSADELQQHEGRLAELTSSDNDFAGQLGFAASVKIAGDAARVSAPSPRGLANLLRSIELIEDPDLKRTYGQLVEANWQAADERPRRAALAAASQVPGKERPALQQLSTAIAHDRDVETAIRSLQRIDLAAWPSDITPSIAQTLVALVQRTDASERTMGPARDAMDLARSVANALPAEAAARIQAGLDTLIVQQYQIHAPFEQMAFAPDVLVVPAGRAIEIVFRNDDDKPHNFLLAETGKFEDVGLAAQAMATTPEGQAKHYVPDSGVLQATTMIWPEQEARLNFAAPARPGVYPFVCTFPGHWLKMYGAMLVVEDVEVYLAEHAELPTADELLGKKTVKEWNYEDLAADASMLYDAPRSYDNGRQLFARVSCVACHKIGKDGLYTGNIGPELTDISTKHKTPEALLEQILHPSLKIEDKYASVVIVADGVVLKGVVVDRTDTALVIKENPLVNCEPKTVRIEDIEEEQKSDVSPMPAGLLNSLYKEEILDLLAFVFSGGDAAHELFQQIEN